MNTKEKITVIENALNKIRNGETPFVDKTFYIHQLKEMGFTEGNISYLVSAKDQKWSERFTDRDASVKKIMSNVRQHIGTLFDKLLTTSRCCSEENRVELIKIIKLIDIADDILAEALEEIKIPQLPPHNGNAEG